MVRVFHLTKHYKRGVVALEDVSFDLPRGSFVYLTGPSGSGKTTLLRLLSRVERPTEGQILIKGQNIARLRGARVAYLRRQIGFIFQDFKLLPHRTVYENISFVLQVLGHSPREMRRKIEAVLEQVGLRDKMKRYPYELSGGEQQRVAIARALVKDAELILADEPTGNLDPDISDDIVRCLEGIWSSQGRTVIFATHNRYLIDRFPHATIGLEKGRIVQTPIDFQ